MRKALVLGANGFIGQHMERRLKAEGYFVVSVGRSHPKYRPSIADEFCFLDLRIPHVLAATMVHDFDECYQLAGNVGGLGHIAVGANDIDIMSDSALINIGVLATAEHNIGKIFFASSQCVYPTTRTLVHDMGACREDDASFDTFPFAQEKLFSEELYRVYHRKGSLKVCVGRYGNTFGPYCTWEEPRAKAPAAICRKVAQAPYGGVVDLWGSGLATRSFTYIDDCIEGTRRLMASDYSSPVNIASSEMVTVAGLFETTCKVAGKIHGWRPTPGPEGVRGRNSDNTLCKQVLDWEPATSLEDGLRKTYPWVRDQVALTEVYGPGSHN